MRKNYNNLSESLPRTCLQQSTACQPEHNSTNAGCALPHPQGLPASLYTSHGRPSGEPDDQSGPGWTACIRQQVRVQGCNIYRGCSLQRQVHTSWSYHRSGQTECMGAWQAGCWGLRVTRCKISCRPDFDLAVTEIARFGQGTRSSEVAEAHWCLLTSCSLVCMQRRCLPIEFLLCQPLGTDHTHGLFSDLTGNVHCQTQCCQEEICCEAKHACTHALDCRCRQLYYCALAVISWLAWQLCMSKLHCPLSKLHCLLCIVHCVLVQAPTRGGGCPPGVDLQLACTGHSWKAPQMTPPSGSTPCACAAFRAAPSCDLPGETPPHGNCLVTPVACMEQTYVCILQQFLQVMCTSNVDRSSFTELGSCGDSFSSH